MERRLAAGRKFSIMKKKKMKPRIGGRKAWYS